MNLNTETIGTLSKILSQKVLFYLSESLASPLADSVSFVDFFAGSSFFLGCEQKRINYWFKIQTTHGIDITPIPLQSAKESSFLQSNFILKLYSGVFQLRIKLTPRFFLTSSSFSFSFSFSFSLTTLTSSFSFFTVFSTIFFFASCCCFARSAFDGDLSSLTDFSSREDMRVLGVLGVESWIRLLLRLFLGESDSASEPSSFLGSGSFCKIQFASCYKIKIVIQYKKFNSWL